jgi:NDP-sugar pyrophosphorylase family protein
MIIIENFIKQFPTLFPGLKNTMPWEITNGLAGMINEFINGLDGNYIINDGIAVHMSAVIEQNVVLKSPVIISANCFIAANVYIREGAFLGESVKIGAGCEIKQSVIFSGSAIAHFNYIGNSLIGSNVNFEAGAVAANHYNERPDKKISVFYNSGVIETGSEKFGALVGDNSRIGANAVLSPGTILEAGSVVKRLELIEQVKL